MKYINFITNDDFACSTLIMQDGLFLISDLCNCYKKDIKVLLDPVILKKMYKRIDNDEYAQKDPIISEGLIWVKESLNQTYISN